MVTKEFSSAPKAENNPMEKFETILQAGNKCLNNVAQSNQSVKRTVEDATRKFFASHDHLKKEVKDEFLRFTGVLVVELEASRKKDGVPVDESVAAHFFPTIPLLPTPEIITLPFLQLSINLTIFVNVSFILFLRKFSASISNLITSLAIFFILFICI